MKSLLIFLIGFLTLLSSSALAATIFEDDFNDYNTGDLAGQGDWTGSTAWDVQNTAVFEGAKAISGNTYNTQVDKAGVIQADGQTTFYFYNEVGSIFYFMLKENGSDVSYCKLTGGVLSSYAGGWTTRATGISQDEWHYMTIEWRSSDEFDRFTIDEEEPSDWVAMRHGFISGVDGIALNQSGDAGKYVYIDHIAENPYEEEENQINITLLYFFGITTCLMTISIFRPKK